MRANCSLEYETIEGPQEHLSHLVKFCRLENVDDNVLIAFVCERLSVKSFKYILYVTPGSHNRQVKSHFSHGASKRVWATWTSQKPSIDEVELKC